MPIQTEHQKPLPVVSNQGRVEKNVSYQCHIQLDSRGALLEVQCECVAGLGHGVHCKHMFVTLHALQTFCHLEQSHCFKQ